MSIKKHFGKLVLLGLLVTLFVTPTVLAGNDHGAHWSHDGEKLVYYSYRDGNPQLWTMSPEGKEHQQITDNDNWNIEPRWSPDNSKIAFSTGAGMRSMNIAVMDFKTRQVTYLTQNEAFMDYAPKWSPNGSRIIFASNRDGDNEIYSINSDGTQLKKLTNNDDYDSYPAFSPDGQRIAWMYHAGADTNSDELWLMKSDGTGGYALIDSQGDIIHGSAPNWSLDGKTLVYINAHNEVELLELESKKLTTITENNVDEYFSSISPDSQFITFDSMRLGSSDIFRFDRHTQKTINLTRTSQYSRYPQWASDGTKFLFISKANGSSDVFVSDAKGKNIKPLIQHNANEEQASWSPDGKSVVFSSDRSGNMDIYAQDLKTNKTWPLTDNNASDTYPSWSPDGNKVVFVSARTGNREVYTVNVDGSGMKQLTLSEATEFMPSWSSDGKEILFTSSRDGNFEIYKMNADGSAQVNLTNHESADFFATWSSDGKSILFASGRDGNSREIYQMNSDGSNTRKLFEHEANEYTAAFSPNKQQVVFESNRDGGDYGLFLLALNNSEVTAIKTKLK